MDQQQSSECGATQQVVTGWFYTCQKEAGHADGHFGLIVQASQTCDATDSFSRCAREAGHDGQHDCGWSF